MSPADPQRPPGSPAAWRSRTRLTGNDEPYASSYLRLRPPTLDRHGTLERVRFAGVDLGLRRIGLAVSDASGTLARPWKAIAAGATPAASAALVRGALAQYSTETGAAAAGEPAGLTAFE